MALTNEDEINPLAHFLCTHGHSGNEGFWVADSRDIGFTMEPGNTFSIRSDPDGVRVTGLFQCRYLDSNRSHELVVSEGKRHPEDTAEKVFDVTFSNRLGCGGIPVIRRRQSSRRGVDKGHGPQIS